MKLVSKVILCVWISLIVIASNRVEVLAEVVSNNAGNFTIISEPRIVEGKTIREVTRFSGVGDPSVKEDFKDLVVDGENLLIGSRNRVYVVSLSQLNQVDVINWEPAASDINICKGRMRTEEECQNYIRVIVKQSKTEVYICGTNAFKPWCRTYNRETIGYTNFPVEDHNGIGKCPFHPSYNNTAIFSGERLFSGTVTDIAARDALIYGKGVTQVTNLPALRTEQYSSRVLNEPSFVSSFEFQDKVYFFFRETAVEAINCGKTVYSRVGRVCKNDRGGMFILQKSWTSFFKTRLNCSMPGSFPFYFDEIQSTSEIGQGNYMPAITVDNRTDMVYAVFNTPENSIHGSAVCVFRFTDIVHSFEGPFKSKKSPHSNWLPLSEAETPNPHPASSCSNVSETKPDQTLNFIKSHPLMDQAVPAFGGKPVLVQTSPHYRLTVIAVDWQVYAADAKRYDVLFIGTTDGRVVKSINKGGGSDNMNTVVIEDIQVFEDRSPVVNIKVHSDQGRLLVVSKNQVKSILLQRCHRQTTCSDCVMIQDPYCSWHEGLCRYSRKGYQSIDTARHHMCEDDGSKTTNKDRRLTSYFTTEMSNEIPQFEEPSTGAMAMSDDGAIYGATEMAVAIIFTLLIALTIGFVLGYIVRNRGITINSVKRPQKDNNSKYESPQKNLNELKKPDNSGNIYENSPASHCISMPTSNHLSNNPHQSSLNSLDSRKQVNIVVNDISGGKSTQGRNPNENVETCVSPSSKLKKQVYL